MLVLCHSNGLDLKTSEFRSRDCGDIFSTKDNQAANTCTLTADDEKIHYAVSTVYIKHGFHLLVLRHVSFVVCCGQLCGRLLQRLMETDISLKPLWYSAVDAVKCWG